MKTRIISIILVVTLFFSTTLSAYADTKQDDFNEAYSIPDLVKNEKYIKGEEQNGNCVIESESVFVSIPINTDDLISIEVKDDEKSPALRMMIPNSVFTSKGRINENGCVEYFSKDESSALYVGVLSDDNKICDSVCSLITIKNANAPKQYKFSFDLPEGYSIVERSYYFNNYASEEEIEALGIESSEQILFILDDNNRVNLARVRVADDDDNEVYEVPPVNDIAP